VLPSDGLSTALISEETDVVPRGKEWMPPNGPLSDPSRRCPTFTRERSVVGAKKPPVEVSPKMIKTVVKLKTTERDKPGRSIKARPDKFV